MIFNGINYGSSDSLSKHTGIPAFILRSYYGHSFIDPNKEITTYLHTQHTPNIVFMRRRVYTNIDEVYKELERLYAGQSGVHRSLDISLQDFKNNIKRGQLFDEAIHPNSLIAFKPTPKVVSVPTNHEQEVLKALNLSLSDVETVKRIFNLVNTAEVINFINYNQSVLQNRRS